MGDDVAPSDLTPSQRRRRPTDSLRVRYWAPQLREQYYHFKALANDTRSGYSGPQLSGSS